MSVDPANAIDVHEAVGPLAAMLAREDGEEQPVETPAESAPAQAEVPAETPAQETAPAEGEAEGEQAPVEEGETSEEQQQEPQKYTVKVGGETQEVTLDEALKGYQRTADYTRKTMALSEKEKSIEAERVAVNQERAQLAQLLPALQQRLEQSMPAAPDQRLKETNPIDYFVLKGEYDEKMQQLNAVKGERQHLESVQRSEFESRKQKLMAESNAKLSEIIPDWKDPVKQQALVGDLREYAKELGFSDEELSETYDHRAIRALYEGMKGRKQAQKLASATPPRPVQTGPKAAAPGSAVTSPGRKVTEVTRVKQRLAQTGSIDDAANFFLQSGTENF